MRIKKSKHPQPFQIISPNIVQNGDFERLGECVGNVDGYSCVLLDVLCAPLTIGKKINLRWLSFDSIRFLILHFLERHIIIKYFYIVNTHHYILSIYNVYNKKMNMK